MIVPSWQDPAQTQLAKAVSDLESCNRAIERYGLSLTTQDIQALVAGRLEALEVSERIEFGGGVVGQIVLAFAGSPFVSQENFVPTVLELQELFYDFKNESVEQIPDDDLIAKMRSLFDDPAQGDLGYLEEVLFEGLARTVRDELVTPSKLGFHDRTDADKVDANTGFDDAADPDADNAAANAHWLAQHRFDIGKWVDDKYEPGREGSSWLDE